MYALKDPVGDTIEVPSKPLRISLSLSLLTGFRRFAATSWGIAAKFSRIGEVERAIVTNLRQEKAASDIGSAGWAQNQDLLLSGAVLKARRSACM